MYKTVMFDLDGTLTESAPGITTSISVVLDRWGIPYKDLKELEIFVGPPLKEAIRDYYNMTDEKAAEFVREFRAHYTTEGLFINSVYPGVEDLLKRIKESGRKVMMATSKPEVTAIRIIEHFGIAKYFDEVAGATEDNSRVLKADVIRYLMGKLPEDERNKDEFIMVGDREHDIYGAKEVGVDSIGVLYGYGSREEFEKAGATYIAETASEVFDFL